MRLINYIIIALVFCSLSSFGQDTLPRIGTHTPKGFVCRGVVYQGDTIPFCYLQTVTISSTFEFKNKQELNRYYKLKRDIRKVYPYAILASAKLKEYNHALAKLPFETQRKAYMKKAERELKDQFEEELKQMTITQGRLLIKLIDRETGNTSYELVKDLRGSFSAFMWQAVAKMFGSSLKSEYDPNGADRNIERVIREIENGG